LRTHGSQYSPTRGGIHFPFLPDPLHRNSASKEKAQEGFYLFRHCCGLRALRLPNFFRSTILGSRFRKSIAFSFER
jgi:hypothetical protein